MLDVIIPTKNKEEWIESYIRRKKDGNRKCKIIKGYWRKKRKTTKTELFNGD